MQKKWYQSKTIWVNVVASIALIIQTITGEAWIDAELQGAIIVLVNIILRIVTKQGLY